MRDVAEQAIGWLVPAGIICAIVLARRRYRGKYQSDIAAAEARGEANALASVAAQQHVNVAVDASNRGAGDHECLDPFTCSVCAPALLRIVRAYRGVGVAGSSWTRAGDYDDEHDYDDSRADDYGRVVRGRRGELGSVVSDDSGSAESDRNGRADAGAVRGVEGLPSPELRPELFADMLRRPWAYDEADPRFEHGVPVANGRRGRGPGR